MKTIVLIVHRIAVAQGFIARTREFRDIEVILEPDYTNAEATIQDHLAQAALIEVAEGGECDIDYCLTLCARIRETTPDCKLLMMCPESDKQAVEGAVAAKREGRIDDFVFYDVTLDYLLDSFEILL